MRLLRFFIIATLLLTSACVKMTSVRSNPSYDRILKERTAAAFLPSQVEVNTVGVGSKTRMYDYEANLEGVINRDVPPLLRAKGYNLKTYRKADVHAANISHQVLRFRSKYDEQMKKLYPTIAMKEELAFNTQHNFGKEAEELGKATNSDLLVLVDYSGTQKTNGSRALGFAMDVLLNTNQSSNVDGALMMLSFVDAKTGEFLWSDIITDAKSIYGSAWDNMSSQEEVDIQRVKGMAMPMLNLLPNKQ